MSNLDYYKYNFFNKDFLVKEVSFYETRLLLKKINSPDLEEVFDNLLSICVKNENLNVLEKIILLFYIRGFIFGNEVTFNKDGKEITVDLIDIVNEFTKEQSTLTIKIGGLNYNFSYVKNFNSFNDKLSLIESSLLSVNGIDIQNVEDKLKYLPAININEIYTQIFQHFYSFNYELKILDYDLNIDNILNFLKTIYTCELMDLYEIEYKLRRLLNFSSEDLKNNSLPECRILMNLYIKESKESEVEQQMNQ
jgi:hypothetical protein